HTVEPDGFELCGCLKKLRPRGITIRGPIGRQRRKRRRLAARFHQGDEQAQQQEGATMEFHGRMELAVCRRTNSSTPGNAACTTSSVGAPGRRRNSWGIPAAERAAEKFTFIVWSKAASAVITSTPLPRSGSRSCSGLCARQTARSV